MKNDLIRTITRNAIVAAIYVVLTISTSAFSFGMIQVRIAEALMLLCFFRRDYIWGLTLGCLIANLFSPMLPWDLIIGTAATFLSCACICLVKQMFIAALFPVIFNAFMVAGELHFILGEGYWISAAFVGLGEFIAVCVIGYILFMIIKRDKKGLEVLGANRNLEVKW